MNMRVVMVGLIGVTFFLLSHRPASAMVEFCPAMLKYEAVSASGAPTQHPVSESALYGFVLNAFAARTLTSARLAFDTSNGWYTVDLANVTITPKDRHYPGTFQPFVVHDYVSPVMYVRFPHDVRISHAWVYVAVPANRAQVTCDPPAAPSQRQLDLLGGAGADISIGPAAKDDDHLSAEPSANSEIVEASAAKPLETANCAEPFRDPIVEHPYFPRVHDVAKGFIDAPLASTATVAIDRNGALADSDVWATSGYKALDDETLRMAKLTIFGGARSYCRAVPSYAHLSITLDPWGVTFGPYE